jgi:hypothetical protein
MIAKENIAEDFITNHGSNGPINVTYSNYYAPDGLIASFVHTMELLGIPANREAVWNPNTFLTRKDNKQLIHT